MPKETKVNESFIEILPDCLKVTGYFHLLNEKSPIRRLYVKNKSVEDAENIELKIYSEPEFMLPCEIKQELLPRRSTAKFEVTAKLNPLFMVSLDKRTTASIVIEVWQDNELLASERRETELLGFNECDYSESAESAAGFVRRTAAVNKLVNAVNKKLTDWNVPLKGAGYRGSRNSVRNYFAACFSVLSELNFTRSDAKFGDEFISSHEEMLRDKLATPLELALLFASLVESNGQNAVIALVDKKWYAGCFLTNECFSDVVNDDIGLVRQKLERGVNDITLVCVNDTFNGVSFEKAEKSAAAALRKTERIEFILDLKRARIMHVLPLPERVKSEDGYDLVQSADYATSLAPKQIREYKGSIGGEKEISRVTQWERKLLDMDMRNALLNFKVSQTAVKMLVPSLEDFLLSVGENKRYSLENKPKDAGETVGKISNDVERANYLKPFADYISYEYKNKRLRTVYDAKEHESTLLRLYRKEKSMEEETGTLTLYVAAGFLKWCENDDVECKYAPLFLYPVTLTKKGVAQAQFTLDVNGEEARVNSTLLEFLYQEFDLDMRGLQDAELNDSEDLLAVLARIRREIVGFKRWEVIGNVFLATLSFANYQLWYDVKYRREKFREHPIVGSLIDNRLKLVGADFDMSDKSSDEAYTSDNKIYLPISADSSQYSAIVDSLSKSFVLHGPPGTGKSQTITNIIANNIVRGRRVLFVAEKMAALSVVHKRLCNVGIGDFCLELHSNKTNKNTVLNHIVNTLSLAEVREIKDSQDKLSGIRACISRLSGELDAMHRKRFLGFSLYEAVLDYFENKDAPDCLSIDELFYEKLTETSFNNYLEVLTELSLRAKECGDIDRSPFKHIGRFDYSEKWRASGEAVLEIYLLELKHLRQYAKNLMPLFNVRTVSLSEAKIDALYCICKILRSNYVVNYFRNLRSFDNGKGIVDSFNEAFKKNGILLSEYSSKYGVYPADVDTEAVYEAAESGYMSRSVKRCFPGGLEKKDRAEFVEYLAKCEKNRETLSKRTSELASLCELTVPSVPAVRECALKLSKLFDSAQKLYADADINLFNECCVSLTKYEPNVYLEYFCAAYDNCAGAKHAFDTVFCTDGGADGADITAAIEYVSAIQKNLDFIPNWCRYQEIVEKCRSNGFEFVLEPLSAGDITADDILSCFKKRVYYHFIKSELYLDDVLCQFSGLTLEETANKFRQLTEEYERLTRQELYEILVDSLPRPDATGDHNLERVLLMRAEKTNMKGTTLRNLFKMVPNILKATCPCMMMSPTSVSQFLDFGMDKFDLVVFDEASQVPTCKAVGSIARGKNVVVVGDPQQLPPTSFFSSDFKDDEHFDVEDLESILDDCLALGMPENHLLWHYRSNHESLIAFSNATFYDNTLLTFPSPNELNSKVTFKYVDGVYERGGSKCNKKEAEELVSEVIARLKNPATRSQSIGIVTLNTAQQNYIENLLSRQIHSNNLDAAAYERDEPLFVKNLENVQGDERDVILFGIGYGPDSNGKLSLNFGPINQSGGYKRLNVAVTRARSEMRVFSAITGNMIDLSRTDSKGVQGLKAFLEYAERGREMLAINSSDIAEGSGGIGALIAADLKDKGILCDYNVGVSGFRIDVAVIDPRNKDKYILAIICDSENSLKLKGVKDRIAMQSKILRKLGWNTYQLWSINYFNNPKREIAKIKDHIATLTDKKVINKKTVRDAVNRYRVSYKSYYSKPLAKPGADYVLNFVNEEKIMSKIRDIIEVESPVEEHYLIDKLLVLYNIPKTAKRAVTQLTQYVEGYASFRQEFNGKVFYADKQIDTFRPSDTKISRDLTRVHPHEIIAAAKCAVETRLNLTREEAPKEIASLFGTMKRTKAVNDWIDYSLSLAISSGQIMVTVDDVLTD